MIYRSDNLDLIKSIVKITDVIRDSGIELKGNKGLCPFHEEKTPSFFAADKRGRFKCFGCGESGDIFDFVQRFYGMDFPHAVNFIKERYISGIDVNVTSGYQARREAKKAEKERIRQLWNQLIKAQRKLKSILTHEKPSFSLDGVSGRYVYATNHIDLINLFLDEFLLNENKFLEFYGKEASEFASYINNDL